MRAALPFVAGVVVLSLSLGGCATPLEETRAATLVGSWRLLAVETVRDDGGVTTAWMGDEPVGLITYQPDGLMSVQIMRDPRPSFASGSRASATPEELKSAFFGYYAYWGSYTVHGADSSVSHRLTASLYPEEVGITYTRYFRREGQRLVLTTAPISYDGRRIVNRLTWEKVLP